MFHLDEFNLMYQQMFPDRPTPNSSFLEWLIGFAEGDGSFVVNKRGDLAFVITQSSDDIGVLNYIKDNLNVGSVIVQSKSQRTHRFIVQDAKSLGLICRLFNGNMVFPTRNARFIEFLTHFNSKALRKNPLFKPIVPKYTSNMVGLGNCWWIGLIESEGCFTISLLANSSTFRARFIVSQKWGANRPVLEHFLTLLSAGHSKPIGAIAPHSEADNWELRVNGLKNCTILVGFLDGCTFHTKKLKSYCK